MKHLPLLGLLILGIAGTAHAQSRLADFFARGMELGIREQNAANYERLVSAYEQEVREDRVVAHELVRFALDMKRENELLKIQNQTLEAQIHELNAKVTTLTVREKTEPPGTVHIRNGAAVRE